MIVKPHSFQTTAFLDSGEDGDGEDEMTLQDFTDFYKHLGVESIHTMVAGVICKIFLLYLLGD